MHVTLVLMYSKSLFFFDLKDCSIVFECAKTIKTYLQKKKFYVETFINRPQTPFLRIYVFSHESGQILRMPTTYFSDKLLSLN